MIPFGAEHRAVHYPEDRRFRIWIRPSIAFGTVAAIALLVVAAWIELAVAGLPRIPPVPVRSIPTTSRGRTDFRFGFAIVIFSISSSSPSSFAAGCPSWRTIRDSISTMTARRGASGFDLRRSRFHATGIWTAKDDARYIVAAQSERPDTGTRSASRASGTSSTCMGLFFAACILSSMLFATDQWKRLVPTSPTVVLQAWNTWVHYATFHLPQEPNGFYGYNALQQIAYFTVVFVFGPLAILTGIAMSPAVVNHFSWYARMFGGRQSARSIHFLTMLSFLAFLIVHVTLVVMTGFARNMNHIVLGTDDQSHLGMWLGFVGIGVVVLCWIVAHYSSWYKPRALQRTLKAVTYPMQLAHAEPTGCHSRMYSEKDISPYFWPNGKMPVREDWKRLVESGFRRFPAQGRRSGREPR